MFKPNGSQLALLPEAWVDVYTLDDWTLALRLTGHTSWERNSTHIKDVKWNASGDWIATVSLDGTACIWDATSGQRIRSLDAHAHYVMWVAWSPDARRLATGDRGGTIIIWDPATGRETLRIANDLGPVEQLAWSQDGTKLLATFEHSTEISVFDTGEAYIRGRYPKALPLLEHRIECQPSIPDLFARAETLLASPTRARDLLNDVEVVMELLKREDQQGPLINRSYRVRAELLRCISLAESKSKNAGESWDSARESGAGTTPKSQSDSARHGDPDLGRCVDAYDMAVSGSAIPKNYSDSVTNAHSAFPDIAALENIAGVLKLRQGHFQQAAQTLENSLSKWNGQSLSEQELRNAKMRLFKVVYWWKLGGERSAESYIVWSILLKELGFAKESQLLPLTTGAVADVARYIRWLESPVHARTYFWIALAKASQGEIRAAHVAYKQGVKWMRLRWDIVDNNTLRIRAQAALAVFEPQNLDRNRPISDLESL